MINALYGAITVDKEIDLEAGEAYQFCQGGVNQHRGGRSHGCRRGDLSGLICLLSVWITCRLPTTREEPSGYRLFRHWTTVNAKPHDK